MRKITALCVAALLVLGGSVHAIAAANAPKSNVNAEFLAGIYRSYNDTYFGGKLPKDTAVLYSADPDDPTNIGATQCSVDPSTMKPMSCTIYVAPYANVAQPVAIETMIHEMCHIQTFVAGKTDGDGSHGKEWTACMLGVAMSGGMDGVW
jgi:hypothetical protein